MLTYIVPFGFHESGVHVLRVQTYLSFLFFSFFFVVVVVVVVAACKQ